VDAAVKLARGETLSTTETIDNGFKKVPAILLEPGAVDRNNLTGTIVKDGYHTLQEICAGLPPEKCPKE
jgi:D-xylose transport system substrate-binding protein